MSPSFLPTMLWILPVLTSWSLPPLYFCLTLDRRQDRKCYWYRHRTTSNPRVASPWILPFSTSPSCHSLTHVLHPSSRACRALRFFWGGCKCTVFLASLLSGLPGPMFLPLFLLPCQNHSHIIASHYFSDSYSFLFSTSLAPVSFEITQSLNCILSILSCVSPLIPLSRSLCKIRA